MASRVNMEKLMSKKEKAMERAMDKKERSIEFSNCLNNAVLVWSTLANHPEIKMEDTLDEIRDLVLYFRTMKSDGQPELPAEAEIDSPEKAADEAEKTFTGSTRVDPPTSKSAASTEPQQRMIHAILSRMNYKDEAVRNQTVSKVLGLDHTITISSLTKEQASSAIKVLLGMEKK